ncbi:intradiol ring-cleavage dioxygenase [Streptomyces sp. NPDC059467]|uniref:intradiol ring-cleavage dioxygenase n=1 Tax=Streptomyces sp. NPDC059467 TaxID=3346844 RepID=UPI0036CC5C7B
MTDKQPAVEPKNNNDLTRRKVVIVGAGTVAAVGLGGGLALNAQAADDSAGGGSSSASSSASPSASSSASSSSAETCYTLTSETTEGPHYIDADKIRQDITEDQDGIPLTVTLKVIDAETCKPLRDAAVDIWHCSALGVYSGYEANGSGGGGGGIPTDAPSGTPTALPTDGSGGTGGIHQEPTDDDRYLRGTWRTDRHGYVTFRTVFPGWYQGRCVHIHVKVHVDGEWTDAGYEGGHTCHTGQLFFDEKSVLLTAEVEPYSTNTTTRTTLDEDTIYPGNGHEGGLLHLKYDRKRIARGVHAQLTMGVAPDETHDNTSLTV